MQPNIQQITSAGHPYQQGGVSVQPQLVHNLHRGPESSVIDSTSLTSAANLNSTYTLQNNGNVGNFDQDGFLNTDSTNIRSIQKSIGAHRDSGGKKQISFHGPNQLFSDRMAVLGDGLERAGLEYGGNGRNVSDWNRCATGGVFELGGRFTFLGLSELSGSP